MSANSKTRYCWLLLTWLLPAIGLAVQAQDRPRLMPPPYPEMAPTYADVIYRDTGSMQLLADVYLPESNQATAAIVWFPPGGFRVRDKFWIRGSIFDQLNRGIAIVSFEYRLGDEAKWPAQAHDGRAAIRWLRSNAKKFNIDAERIFVAGGSAGAILANVIANSHGDESLNEDGAENANLSDAVSGVIAFYGASDLTAHSGWPDKNSTGTRLTGCMSGDCKTMVESASPLYYVSEDSPPALLFHGMGDVVIDYRQSIMLQERLHDSGVDAQLVLRTDLIHGDPRFDEPAMSDLINRFLSGTP